MTALAKDTVRTFQLGDLSDLPVKASTTIYEGAAVGDDGSGYARQLVAGDPFLGFAVKKADNASGSDGDISVTVQRKGNVKLSVGSLAITDKGKQVFASDSDTFTLTATSNSFIGRVIEYSESGVGIVAFDAGPGSLGDVAPLTDNSGGATADGTIGAVTAPSAVTDSTGGTAGTTLAAITSPTAVTNNSGGSTSDTTLASITTGGGTYPDATPTKDAIAKLAVLANANAAAVILLKNDVASLAARQAENRTAIVALTDAVKELSTKINELAAII